MSFPSLRRLFEAIPFLLLSFAVVVQATQPTPSGPWDGIYTSYLLYWLLLALSCAVMIGVVHYYQVSWTIVGGFALLSFFTVVSHSYLWAAPWGFHDSWRHLGVLRARQLAFSSNVYPMFHSALLGISAITGIDPKVTLSKLLLLIGLYGLLLIMVVVRHTTADRSAQQVATIVMMPGLFLGFIPRPFSLAYPCLLLGFWLSASQSSRLKFASLPILITLVFIHPFIAALTAGILLISSVFTLIPRDRLPLISRNFHSNVSVYILIALGLELVYYLLVLTGFSEGLIVAIVEAFLWTEVSTATGGPAGAGLIAEAFSSSSKFIEFSLRSSFLFSLALAALISLFTQLRRRSLRRDTVVTTFSGLGVFALFLVLAFVPEGIGVTRLFILAPLFFLPLLPYAFNRLVSSQKLASIGLAILIVSTGLVTGFLWPGIGGVEYSATDGQVSGVEWAVEHDTVEIVGTSMTHWIVVGQYGRQTSTELSATSANGMLATRLRPGGYSWEVLDRPPNALYFVDGAEEARATQAAREGNPEPLSCLEQFQRHQTRVYHSGDTEVFTISRKPACGVER